MTDEATRWRGRVLRAWRESCGISQSDLAAVGYVTPQAVSNWERGMAGSKSETIQNATSALKHALRLDELHTTALLDTVAASGSIACPPRLNWSHNYPPPTQPVWAWIRSDPPASRVRATLRWGSPFRGVLEEEAPTGGIFLQAPGSIPNPPFECILDKPGWVDFGGGWIPSNFAKSLDAHLVDAVALVDPNSPIEDPGSREIVNSPAIRHLLRPLNAIANHYGAKWELIVPHLGLFRSDRVAVPVDGMELQTLANAGDVQVDSDGLLLTQMTVTGYDARQYRRARGLSRERTAESATALDRLNPVTAKMVETFETGRLPATRLLLPRLDTVYKADGRLGIEKTFDSGPRGTTSQKLSIPFPGYWTGPVWIQVTTTPEPHTAASIQFEWGYWRRRQQVSTRTVLMTRRAHSESGPLVVTVPRGSRLQAGTGVPPHALDVNHGWYPRNIRSAVKLIEEGLSAVQSARKRARIPAEESRKP